MVQCNDIYSLYYCTITRQGSREIKTDLCTVNNNREKTMNIDLPCTLYHWHKSVQKNCQIALSIYIFTMIGQVPYITDIVWTRVYKKLSDCPLHLCLHNDRTSPYITDTVWTRVYKNTVKLPSMSLPAAAFL